MSEKSLNGLLKDLGIQEGEISEAEISIITTELQPNQMLRQYRILQKIGSGGMGDVYKAVYQHKNVAIKSMKLSTNKNVHNRFIREYQFLRLINHESLIKAYDLFQERAKTYMVMEFVEGKSLKELLETQEKLTLLDKIIIGSKVARGIEILNSAGIIHRDIKPANIMINKALGEVKILDLGLGKQIEKEDLHLTVNNQILGTVMYLSPEQTQGKVTKKSDVFSLGVVLYQLFTGMKESPFKADNAFSSYYMICSEHPPRIKDITNDIENKRAYERLSFIVEKAMAKKIEHRSSAKKVAEELECILAQMQQELLVTQEIKTTNFEITRCDTALLKSLYNLKMQDMDIVTSYKTDRRYPLYKKRSKKNSRLEKLKSKKNKNGISKSVAIVVILIVIIATAYGINQKSNKKRTAEQNSTIESKQQNNLDKKISAKDKPWSKFWNGKWFDFASEDWKKLSHYMQASYAKDYQYWYAELNQKSVRKQFRINGATFELVMIPPGRFSKELSNNNKNNNSEDKILFTEPYWIHSTEITQKQWISIMGNNPSRKVGNSLPVENVSWKECQRFCLKTGIFNLPTEAEWEYAAKGGTTSLYGIGDIISDDIVNYRGHLNRKGPVAVGTLANINSWGGYDFYGNVSEWCSDYSEVYSASDLVNPQKSQNESHISKGGNYSYSQRNLVGRTQSFGTNSALPSCGFRIIFKENKISKIISCISLERYAEAKIHCDHIIKNHSSDLKNKKQSSQMYLLRAKMYYNLKSYHKAIADYERAISIESDSFSHFYNRGFAYEKLKNYHQALLDYDKAIKINQWSFRAYFRRGFIYALMNKYDKAIEAYNIALAINSDYSKVYYYKALAYKNIKAYGPAIDLFKKAASSVHKNPEISRRNIYFNISECYKSMKNNMSYAHYYIKYMKELEQEQNNKVLKILRDSPNDKGLEQLKFAPKILNLSLANAQITNQGLVHLKHLRNIKFLSLDNTQINDEGLRHIASLTTLETLRLNGTKVRGKGLMYLVNLKNLKNLTMSGYYWNSAEFYHVAKLTMLQSLNLYNMTLNDHCLLSLSNLKNLSHLHIMNVNGISDGGLSFLQKLSSLSHLSLSSLRITPKSMSYLRNLKALSILNTCVNIDYLPLLPQLQRLTVTDKNTRKFDFYRLRNYKNLYYLQLSNTNIEEQYLQYLKSIPQLTYFAIHQDNLTSIAINHITKSKSLTKLYFTYKRNITSELIADLSKMTQLKTLQIHYFDASNFLVKKLKDSLPNCHVYVY